MPTTAPQPEHSAPPSLSEDEIRRRVSSCPKLGSLQSVNMELKTLLASDGSPTSRIAEIIQRDPSLSQRLLRMVKSVYFGLSAQITNIEEAVFFLGLRQIRDLSLATPVIEDMDHIQSSMSTPLPWKNLWSHSIGTAILTREILSSTDGAGDDDTDYLVGLLHNVGKVVMAYAFPEALLQVANTQLHTPAEVCALEKELVGWDHGQIGAYFLECHHLVEELSASVRYHNDPIRAQSHRTFASAVQIADHLVRYAGIESGFEKVDPVEKGAWLTLDGWRILYGSNEEQSQAADVSLERAARRLPGMLESLV